MLRMRTQVIITTFFVAWLNSPPPQAPPPQKKMRLDFITLMFFMRNAGFTYLPD